MKFAETCCQNCGASKHDVKGKQINNTWSCLECILLDEGEDDEGDSGGDDEDNYLKYEQDL